MTSSVLLKGGLMKIQSIKRTVSVAAMCLCLLIGTISCTTSTALERQDDTLYQISLLNALMLGDYDGIVTVDEFLLHGDTGIGTFDTLDGEMILIDGEVYKARYTGEVEKQEGSETIPFAIAAHFDPELEKIIERELHSIEDIKELLDAEIVAHENDFNSFYAAIIQGNFSMVHIRSVPPQEKPYRKLSAIASTQPEFIHNNITGTVIAFRFPDYMDKINLPGWHLHFISDDRTIGGHLLDATIPSGSLALDTKRNFSLVLPARPSFAQLPVSTDLGSQTVRVEGKE
jgi:acetolactate decarboxylase